MCRGWWLRTGRFDDRGIAVHRPILARRAVFTNAVGDAVSPRLVATKKRNCVSFALGTADMAMRLSGKRGDVPVTKETFE